MLKKRVSPPVSQRNSGSRFEKKGRCQRSKPVSAETNQLRPCLRACRRDGRGRGIASRKRLQKGVLAQCPHKCELGLVPTLFPGACSQSGTWLRFNQGPSRRPDPRLDRSEAARPRPAHGQATTTLASPEFAQPVLDRPRVEPSGPKRAGAALVFAQEEAGTAVCISHHQGLLLTCSHCVAEGPAEANATRGKWLLFAWARLFTRNV